ncbi:shieldin complex subunit 3 [Leptodactylus fuscus]
MEVILHCRPEQNNVDNLQKIAAGSLEEFPLRLLPKFVPWFPYHLPAFILKPQKCPPFVSVDLTSKVDYDPFDPVNVEPFICQDPTPNLLEFRANTSIDKDKQTASAEQDNVVYEGPNPCETVSKEKMYVRPWSVCTRRVGGKDSAIPPSPELKDILDRLKLNLYHRGRWTILSSVCGDRSMEETWDKLSRLIRHGVLPSCNAILQQDIREIWIFCDLRYCEYIGKLVRAKLNLSGKIDLYIHKHGVILSM